MPTLTEKCPKCGLPAIRQFYETTVAGEAPNWHCRRCELELAQQEELAQSEPKPQRWSARREGLVPMVEREVTDGG